MQGPDIGIDWTATVRAQTFVSVIPQGKGTTGGECTRQIQGARKSNGGYILKVVEIQPLTNLIPRLIAQCAQDVADGWVQCVGGQHQTVVALCHLEIQIRVSSQETRAHIKLAGG